MRSLVLALIGGVTLTLAAAAQPSDPALDQLLKEYQAAWAKGDAKALSALYAENALRVADGQVVRGRAAILAMFQKNFTGPWKGTTVTITQGRTESLGADVRLQEGTYEVTGASGPALRGRFLNTVVRQGGQWRIAGLSAMPDTPPPAK